MSKLKEFFARDSVATGVVAGLGSEVGFCIVLAVVLTVAGEPVMAHLRWFGGMFIPLILVLHHYSKQKVQLKVVKTLIVVLFLTFLPFMIYMLKSGLITMQ